MMWHRRKCTRQSSGRQHNTAQLQHRVLHITCRKATLMVKRLLAFAQSQ